MSYGAAEVPPPPAAAWLSTYQTQSVIAIDAAAVVEPHLREHPERGGVPRPDRGPEATAAGSCCFRDDDLGGFGRIAVAVDTSGELEGELRLFEAGLADDETAVTDEVRIDETFDGEETQTRLGICRPLGHRIA